MQDDHDARAHDGSSASLITWSNKSAGTHFRAVSGDTTKHLTFVEGEDRFPGGES
jgi:hypothetical protein